MLVDKTLQFIGRSGRSDVIRVGIGMPIRSSIEGLESFMECPIHLGYENAGRSSVFDMDAASAIDKGLDSIQFFLNALSLQGNLRWGNGADYEFGDIQEIREEVRQMMSKGLGLD